MSSHNLREIISENFSAFGVGSLPFVDPQKAVEFVLKRSWLMPFWPELPKLSGKETSLAKGERALKADWDGYELDEAAGIYELRKLLVEADKSLALLKCQLLGPLSLSLYAQGLSGSLEERLELAQDAVMKQIHWQRDFLREVNVPILVLLDEPGLGGWSSFDLNLRRKISDIYSYLYIQLSERGNFLGLHCCGSFSIDFLKFPLELLSFDLTAIDFEQFFSKHYLREWRDALLRPVVMVPGVAPAVCDTARHIERDKALQLFKKTQNYLQKLPGRELNLLMWSASCGHANASIDWVEYLYEASLA